MESTTFEFSGVKGGKRIFGDGLYITQEKNHAKYFLAVGGKFIEVQDGRALKIKNVTTTINLR